MVAGVLRALGLCDIAPDPKLADVLLTRAEISGFAWTIKALRAARERDPGTH